MSLPISPIDKRMIAAWVVAPHLFVIALSAQVPATQNVAAAGRPPFTVSEETTAITSPLRADGTIDYVAALNKKYSAGVTPANNGFVAWLTVLGTSDEVVARSTRAELLKACGADETPPDALVWVTYSQYLSDERGLTGDALANATEELVNARSTLWTPKENPELASYLRARDKQLALAAQACELPRWWIPAVSSDRQSAYNMILPALAPWREVAHALCARATMRAQAGDFEGFWKDVRSVKLMAGQIGQGSTLIERLVAVAVDAAANQAMGTVAGSGMLTEVQCKFLTEQLTFMPQLPVIVDGVECLERWNTLEILTTIAKGNLALLKNGNGTPISDNPNFRKLGTIEIEEVDWDIVLKLSNATYIEESAAMRKSDFRQMIAAAGVVEDRVNKWGEELTERNDLAKNAGETREAYSTRVAQSLAGMFVSATLTWKAEVLARRAAKQREMLTVLLAAAQLRAVHGKWPAMQQELVPGVLKKLPIDMYSKDGVSPFRYVVEDGKATVYSVGQNGEDDGGKWVGVGDKDDLPIGAAR